MCHQPPVSRTRSPSPEIRAFKKRFYPAVPSKMWNDWRWQVGHRIRSVAQLEQMLVLSDPEREAMTSESGSLTLNLWWWPLVWTPPKRIRPAPGPWRSMISEKRKNDRVSGPAHGGHPGRGLSQQDSGAQRHGFFHRPGRGEYAMGGAPACRASE